MSVISPTIAKAAFPVSLPIVPASVAIKPAQGRNFADTLLSLALMLAFDTIHVSYSTKLTVVPDLFLCGISGIFDASNVSHWEDLAILESRHILMARGLITLM